jgi:CDP-glycerol glycerophosphotransferase (TagB/SpsB family)
MLPRLDALITDYSSIYFDYLLLDRPVLFFPYDLERYREDERGFYFEYEEVTPGPKARTFDELVSRICELLDGYERERAAWRPERDRVAHLCHAFRDGQSARRLIDRLHEGARARGAADPPRARGLP